MTKNDIKVWGRGRSPFKRSPQSFIRLYRVTPLAGAETKRFHCSMASGLSACLSAFGLHPKSLTQPAIGLLLKDPEEELLVKDLEEKLLFKGP